MSVKTKNMRRWVAASGAVLALAVGGAGVAGAATSGSSSTTTPAAAVSPSTAAATDPATLSHGPGETLLTGTNLAKTTAAAQAAVPGATIIRVETDSGGAAYEAHVQKADGTDVTVKFDASFNVTATQAGFGSGGPRP